jgi:6-bladed beta-propeller
MAGEIREGAMACNGKRMPWMIATALLLLSAAASRAQSVIENPAKPKAANPGRVLKLAEVWRIGDESGEFYFKYPNQLQIADDGTVFVADEKELLRFSPDGRFVRNIFKQGQGPGEISEDFSYFVRGQDLFIQDMNSMRFWRADSNGVFQETINLANRDYRGLVGVLPDGFLFLKTVWPPPSERTGKLMEIPHIVTFVARDGSEKRDIATFRPKDFLAPQAATSMTAKIIALSPDGKVLYAFYGRDYLIEVVDLTTGTVVKRFSRAYPKVPHAEREWEADFRKKYGSPMREYEIDVNNLYPVDDRLWVETSTDDKVRGRLIDVFDSGGRFVDSFYLGAGRALMAVREDIIFCQENSGDETITIVKYRIEK